MAVVERPWLHAHHKPPRRLIVQEPVSRKLPLSMTVANLKQMLFKLFECDVSLQRLAFKVGGVWDVVPW